MDLCEPTLLVRSEIERLGERLATTRCSELWVAGVLDGLCAPTVAIVGTRAASAAGMRRARIIAETLGRAGVCVISGLAVGIDACAHEGALAAGAPTIGVLGSGHRRFFPAANRTLAQRMILSGGAVVSPFSPGHPALPHQFLERNAIVAALADAVVVVEAAARSGSLNTASWAADLGRPVLAFPGDVERPKAAGCNALIRDGAILCRDADDVLSVLPLAAVSTRRPIRTAPRVQPATTLGRAIVARLADGDADPEILAAALDAPAAAIVAALVDLELDGAVAREADGGYALAP